MIKVADVYQQITLEPNLINKNDSLDTVLKTFKRINPIHRSLYVVDQDQTFIGIITLHEIFNIYSIKQRLTKMEQLSKFTLLDYIEKGSTAGRILNSNVSVTVDDDLNHAIQLMIRENLHELPVVDAKGMVIGDLNVHELLREAYYDQSIK